MDVGPSPEHGIKIGGGTSNEGIKVDSGTSTQVESTTKIIDMGPKPDKSTDG